MSGLEIDEVLGKLALFNNELAKIFRDWELAAIGHVGRDAVEIMRKRNAEVMERIKLQERELALMMGEKIEPMQHEAAAVLLPVGGFNG
jgi:hypothetical protein